MKRQTSGNGQNKVIAMTLLGAMAPTNASSFSVTAFDRVSIDDTGATTETIMDTASDITTPSDTTTMVTSADRLTTTTSTTLGGSISPYIVAVSTIALDGSKSDVTTYYDPAVPGLVVEQETIDTSYDGRTITATKYSDLNSTNRYNIVTDTYVENADNTTTETRSGTGSFGAPAFSQTVTVKFNNINNTWIKTTTTLNYDGTGALIGQIVAEVSPNGLSKSFVYDTTGQETANLKTAAADILAGVPLPTLRTTDIIGSDATTLNPDGSKTELIQTAYGNTFAGSNLRSQTSKTTSANGLVTVTKADNNGNGVFNQVETTTIAPDGSSYEVSNYYGDTTATANTLLGSNTYTVSANGLISTLATSTGITDTTANFANSNGSYEWSRSVAPGGQAAASGYQSGSASHFIDANGIDTWSINTGNGEPTKTITIDLATEKQDIAIANEIYQTVLGHQMDDAETQFVAGFITNGILDRVGLATSLIELSGVYD